MELNLDGLVGPTHNYAGLSFGNVASDQNKGRHSNPRAAALQGLDKMRALMELGLAQGVLPPHERPFMPYLRALAYGGGHNSDRSKIITAAWADNPQLLANLYSAAAMWTANAATISPSQHCADGRMHITPANLVAMAHRSLEGPTNHRVLKHIFADRTYFHVHDSLPAHDIFGDEGAANHNVMTNMASAATPNQSGQSSQSGIEIFVYGKKALNKATTPLTYPARQSFEASSAIARRHGLATPNYLLCQQSVQAINAGAFHNDVVCVTHGPVMLYHEQAFENLDEFKKQLINKAEQKAFTPIFVQADQSELSLEDAVRSYIFNCQMVSLPSGDMALILPSDVQHNQAAYDFVQRVLAADNPIKRAIYMDLRQSMRNGGGPACLRLRVPLSQVEFAHMHQGVIMDAAKLDWLEAWVKRHYRDRLSPEDLSDPQLATESFEALDALTQFLDLGSLYDFQR